MSLRSAMEGLQNLEVVYLYPSNGDEYDQLLCSMNLGLGASYKVTEIQVDNWTTHFRLDGFGKVWFNSVNFEKPTGWEDIFELLTSRVYRGCWKK